MLSRINWKEIQEATDALAKLLKTAYDSFVLAGFTEDEAIGLARAMLEQNKLLDRIDKLEAGLRNACEKIDEMYGKRGANREGRTE